VSLPSSIRPHVAPLLLQVGARERRLCSELRPSSAERECATLLGVREKDEYERSNTGTRCMLSRVASKDGAGRFRSENGEMESSSSLKRLESSSDATEVARVDSSVSDDTLRGLERLR
jgi:hypothetical protein